MIKVGEKVGPYRIDGYIGAGGFAEVYEATHERLGKKIALKVLSQESRQNHDVVKRFVREGHALVRFDKHPGVVTVSDVGECPDHGPYLAMELLLGQTLRAWLKERPGPVPVPDALVICQQIANIMANIHGDSVVHRDLKPENIMLVDAPDERLRVRPKILDFGVAKLPVQTGDDSHALTNVQTTGTSILGTHKYISPEQCDNADQITPKADVYALGIMLYEMLAGRLPFESNTTVKLLGMHLFTPPAPLHEVESSVPQGVADFVARMLEKNPEIRPSMQECAERLAQGWTSDKVEQSRRPLEGLAGKTDVVSTHSKHQGLSRRWWILPGMFFLVVAVIGIWVTHERKLIEDAKSTIDSCDTTLSIDWSLRWSAEDANNRKSLLTDCLARLTEVEKRMPDAARIVLVETNLQLSDWERGRGTLARAHEPLIEAHRRIEAGKERPVSSADLRQLEALYYSKEGKLLLMEENLPGAQTAFEKSIQLLDAPLMASSENASILATSLIERGDVESSFGNARDAIPWYEHAISLRKNVAFSGKIYDRALVVDALTRRARALIKIGLTRDARDALNEASLEMESLATSGTENAYLRMLSMQLNLVLALVHDGESQWSDARVLDDHVRATARSMHMEDSDHKEIALVLIDALVGLEKLAPNLKEPALAQASQHERCDIARAFVKQDPEDKRFVFRDCNQ